VSTLTATGSRAKAGWVGMVQAAFTRSANAMLLSVPALLVLLLGKRSQVVLPKARDWMNANSWIISKLVLALFIGIEIDSLLSN
jgi:exosortase/archaeosortase